MKDVSYLLKLAGRCQDLEKTAIAPEVVEQLRIWATELTGMAKILSPRLFSSKWLTDYSHDRASRLRRYPRRYGQLQRRDFPRARARGAQGARGLQLKGRRSTEWDPPPQVRFATTRRWRKPDSNRRSQATVSSGASGHAPPREARVG
jgi:hypothetical protein